MARGAKRNNGYVAGLALERSYTCQDCEQGKTIKAELEAEMEGLKHPCKQCGEHEIIVKKATGEPMAHGLCRECFGAKIRAYHASKKKDEPSRKRRGNGTKISVDFDAYPRILEALQKKAIGEVRTVEEQILWECMGGVGMVGEGIKWHEAE